MWDALGNLTLAAEHVALAALPPWYWWQHRSGVVLRRLAPALSIFFLTGAVSHALLAFDVVPSWWPAARAVIVGVGVVPWTWHGLRALSQLPTKEEAAKLAADATAARRIAEAALAAESVAKRQAEDAAHKIGVTLAGLRAELERYHRDEENDEAYRALRRGFHEMANAAAGFPRSPR
jgi:hypothetical protein